MKKPQKILIPVDFSPVAVNAVHYTNSIMEEQPAEVVLVYVNTYINSRNEMDIIREFREFEAEALRDVSFYYEFKILNGNLLTELVNESKRQNADFVITGTKGKRATGLSLAAALIRSVYCPVIVVPEHFRKRPVCNIAFANDYRPISDSEAIKPLWEFALDFKAKVHLFHVNQSKQEVLVPADEAESTLEYYLQSLDHEWVYLSGDNVESTINNFIKENKIDMLAILSRDHGNNQLKSEGRLIAQLTAHAEIPILALC